MDIFWNYTIDFLNYFFQLIFKIILLIKTKHLYLLAIVSSYMGASDPRSLAGHTNRNRQSCKKFEIFLVGNGIKIFGMHSF